MSPDELQADHYVQQLLAKMKDAQDTFSNSKSDLRRHQHELYDAASCDLHIPEGKLAYVRKDCLPPGSNISLSFHSQLPWFISSHWPSVQALRSFELAQS